MKFEEIEGFKDHIKSTHADNSYKRDESDKMFAKNNEMKRPNIDSDASKEYKCIKCEANVCNKNLLNKNEQKMHDLSIVKAKLFDDEKELTWKIAGQKAKIYKGIVTLKQKEAKENMHCNCKGKLCKINHAKY